MKKLACQCSSAPPRPNRPSPANVNDASLSTFRHGTRVLINSLVGATGQIAWTLGATRKSPDFVAPLQPVSQRLPRMKCYDWIMANLNTHWSLEGCRLVARWCQGPFEPTQLSREAERRAFLGAPTHRHVCHFTPKHGSWLKQAERFFGVLQRRFLARGSFASRAEFDARWQRFLEDSTPATPMRTVGPIRANRWSATRHSAGRVANNITVGPPSARVRNGSNGCFIRLDLTVDKRLSLTWTYEMLY